MKIRGFEKSNWWKRSMWKRRHAWRNASIFHGIFSLTTECTCFWRTENSFNNPNWECSEGGWAEYFSIYTPRKSAMKTLSFMNHLSWSTVFFSSRVSRIFLFAFFSLNNRKFLDETFFIIIIFFSRMIYPFYSIHIRR